MEAWEKAEPIRRYASALADEASRRGPIEPGSEFAKWLAWAKRYADWTDPLNREIGAHTSGVLGLTAEKDGSHIPHLSRMAF